MPSTERTAVVAVAGVKAGRAAVVVAAAVATEAEAEAAVMGAAVAVAADAAVAEQPCHAREKLARYNLRLCQVLDSRR